MSILKKSLLAGAAVVGVCCMSAALASPLNTQTTLVVNPQGNSGTVYAFLQGSDATVDGHPAGTFNSVQLPANICFPVGATGAPPALGAKEPFSDATALSPGSYMYTGGPTPAKDWCKSNVTAVYATDGTNLVNLNTGASAGKDPNPTYYNTVVIWNTESTTGQAGICIGAGVDSCTAALHSAGKCSCAPVQPSS